MSSKSTPLITPDRRPWDHSVFASLFRAADSLNPSKRTIPGSSPRISSAVPLGCRSRNVADHSLKITGTLKRVSEAMNAIGLCVPHQERAHLMAFAASGGYRTRMTEVTVPSDSMASNAASISVTVASGLP